MICAMLTCEQGCPLKLHAFAFNHLRANIRQRARVPSAQTICSANEVGWRVHGVARRAAFFAFAVLRMKAFVGPPNGSTNFKSTPQKPGGSNG